MLIQETPLRFLVNIGLLVTEGSGHARKNANI